MEGGGFDQFERPDILCVAHVLNCQYFVSDVGWSLGLDTTAACTAGRLHAVSGARVAWWVWDCLQLEETWLENLVQASSLVLQISTIVVFELLQQ